MGEPIIIWPPDGGNFDYGDIFSPECAQLGEGYVDCTDGYDVVYGYEADSGLVCC